MAVTDLDAKLLVDAHNDGDDEAFVDIVRAHQQDLFFHALGRLHDGSAAEDAVQETFVRAYRAMPRFEGQYHLRAWLHRILRNVCHDEGARRQRDGQLLDRVASQAWVPVEAADVGIERIDGDREVVVAALAALPVPYKEALVLRYVQELSYEEVAAATGVTAGNARVRVMRGRAALKRALTSSQALVFSLAPFLRRAGRPSVMVEVPGIAATAQVSASAGSNLLANAPLLLRVTDAAPQLAERVASIPQILGMVATLAVPIAAPVVGDQVGSWVGQPPAVSTESVGQDVVATAPTTVLPPTSRPGPAPRSPAAEPTRRATVGGAADESTGVAPTEPQSSTTLPPPASPPVTQTLTLQPAPTPAPTPTSLLAPPGSLAPPPATARPVRRPRVVLAPPQPSASLVTLSFSMRSDRIGVVGETRKELFGAVTWGDGGGSVVADLSGTLVLDAPTDEAAAPSASGEPSSGAEGAPAAAGPPPGELPAPVAPPQAGAGATDGADGAVDVVAEGDAPPVAAPEEAADVLAPPATRDPQGFTAELTIALADGRTYRLSLVDGALDPLASGTAMASAFDLRDACGTLLATGTVSGDLALSGSPVPSSLALSLSGQGPSTVLPCR